MHACLVQAFSRHPRSHYLAEAVIVCRLDVKAIFNLRTHGLGPWFTGKHGVPESEGLCINAHFVHAVGNNQSI